MLPMAHFRILDKLLRERCREENAEHTLTTSVNKLYSIRINQVRCTLSRVGGHRKSARAQLPEHDWTFNLHLQTSLGVPAPRSSILCTVLTVGSSSGLLRHWLACRSPRAKCRTTRNSQQSSPSRTPGKWANLPAPRWRRSRWTRLQCLKAVAAPKPSPWLGRWGMKTMTAHYSFCLQRCVVAVVVLGLQP